MSPRIWLIGGPTSSGKSALALSLARATGGEIINADSMQVYRDLRLITARPSLAEESLAPHHLFGVADAAEAWSTGVWLRAALQTLEAIRSRGKPAIFVGGTGLYFRALTDGLADIPEIPADIRAEVALAFDADGEAAFRARLAVHDPKAAQAIYPGDRQRLIRAAEVYAATGRSLSAWKGDTAPGLDPGSWTGLVMDPPRAELYARCDARLAAMVEAGALEEVAAITARRLDPILPAMKAIGVREFASHLAGEISLETALAAAQQETRRYAKRQLTWLRNQASDWPRRAGNDIEETTRRLIAMEE